MSSRLSSVFAVVLGVLFLAFASPGLATAQEGAGKEDPGKGALREAFARGDAQTVLARAADRVALDLPGGSSQYSRSQAVYVMQRFFQEHPPRRFAWQHTSSKEGGRFFVGRYWHEAGTRPMRVHLRMAKTEGQWKLHEVRVQQP